MEAFTEPRFEIGTRRKTPIWFLGLLSLGAVLICVLFGIVALNPSSARLSDLCDEDLATVNAIRSKGILVFGSEIKPTFKPHVILTVHHDRERQGYYVTRVSLRSTLYSGIAGLLSNAFVDAGCQFWASLAMPGTAFSQTT